MHKYMLICLNTYACLTVNNTVEQTNKIIQLGHCNRNCNSFAVAQKKRHSRHQGVCVQVVYPNHYSMPFGCLKEFILSTRQTMSIYCCLTSL